MIEEIVEYALSSARKLHAHDEKGAQQLAYQIICYSAFRNANGAHLDGFLDSTATLLNQTPIKFKELAQKDKECWFDAVR